MKLLWDIFDVLVIVVFMIIGMAVADHNGVMIWYGAFGGLVTHSLLRMVLRTIRNHVRL